MALLGRKLGVWEKIKRLALTDVGALVRGLKGDEIEALERLLIEADFGVPATMELVEKLERQVRSGTVKTEADLRKSVVGMLAEILGGTERRPLARGQKPGVIVVIGVNGAGKTTTVAKLAHLLRRQGNSVLLGAADTYRAGAIAQLETWAERLGIPVVSGASGGDPAAVAFDAVTAAVNRNVDYVIIDTAGRLHTQEGLMAELGKVARVIDRKLPGAPHEVLLVLDGTVGQNAVQQGKQFAAVMQPTGLVVTKLDGSARGGALVALRRELDVPVRYVGVGEKVEDLREFSATEWAEELLAAE